VQILAHVLPMPVAIALRTVDDLDQHRAARPHAPGRTDLHIRACGVPPRKPVETFKQVNDLKLPARMPIVPK
jgi:hypothetical protein